MAATKQADRPGAGTLDAQPKKVTVDSALNEVDASSEAAAFSFLPADLEAARARREELGLANDRDRVLAESRKAELAAAERRLARDQAQVDALRAEVDAGKAETAADSDSGSKAKAAKE